MKFAFIVIFYMDTLCCFTYLSYGMIAICCTFIFSKVIKDG
ncbi:hypothetical protein [Campylobacter upsaliensis]|nr:hypothetical protein [Campylobacter upsaliensis]MCR2099685.1 hypothetical protein [Campylobacter upsaliensis]